MIFKTFNNDIDKISAKWGVFGRSFNEIGNAIVGRISDINKGFQATDDLIGSIKNSDSVWKRLYPNKESIKSQLIDIDSLYPNIDNTTASKLLSKLQNEQTLVNANKKSWQDYFSELEEGEKWQIEFVQNTDLQKASLDDVKKSYNSAREAAITHNQALQQQTLGAKAAATASKALAVAGNMLLMLGISEVISLAAAAIDDYVHRVEKCKERADEMVSTFNSAIDTANEHKNTIEEIGGRYEELSKGVNNLGENVSLTTGEYSEYNDICNQIAEMFPTMVQGYTSEGNAILKLKGNVDALTEAYEAEAQAAYNALIVSGKDSGGNDIIADWKYSLEEDKGKGTNITKAIKELQAFVTSDMDAEMYTMLREKASAGIYDGMTDTEKLIAGSEFLPFKIQFDLDEDGIITDEELAKAKESAKVLLQTYNAEIESDFSNVRTLANAYLMTNEDFKKLDEQSQSAASLLINSIPATSDIAQVLMTGTKEEIGEYVNFLVQALSSDNPEVKNALINLLTSDTEDMSPDEIASFADSYITTIANYLHRDENELKIQLGFEDVDDLAGQYQRVIEQTKAMFDGYDPAAFFKENSINTQEEIDKWLEIAQAANSAAEAEEMYLRSSSSNNIWSLTDSQSQAIDNFQSTISELSGYLEKELSGTLTDTDLSRLLSDFPSLTSETDNLTAAIRELISGKLDTLLSLLGDDCPEELKKALKGSASEAVNFAGDVNQLQTDLILLENILYRVQNGESLNADDIAVLTNRYGSLGEAVVELANGGYSIEKEKLLELMNSKVEESNTAISCQLEQTKAALEQVQLRIRAYKAEKEALAGLGNIASLVDSGREGTAIDIYGTDAVIEYQNLQDEAAYYEGLIDKLEEQYKTNLSQKKNIGKASGNSSSSTKSQSKETFDFIETALSRIEQTIDRISKRVSATYKSYRYRNNALSEELDLLKQEQQMQKEAYDSYMERANAVGLDEDAASKVRNGDMGILDTADDALSGQISEYKQYYEAAQECVGAVQDLRDRIAELARTRFDMITEQYDNYLSTIEHRQNVINNDIELAEAQNKIAGTSFYEALIAQENRRLLDLNAEYEKLTRAMDDAVLGGGITKGSDMWYDMKQQIDSISESIQESNLNLIEFERSLKAVQKLVFDATESQYDNAMKLLTDEMGMIDSAVSLIETGGHLAGADYYGQLMTAAQAEIDTNTEKLEELEKQFEGIEEYSDDWYDAASSIDAARSAIMDAAEALIKYQNAMRELDWTVFDRTQTAITGLADEQSWLADILGFSENGLYNDNGTFTDKGLAAQGLHVLNHEIYARQAQLYADEIRELEKELEKDPANTTLLDRYDSLIEAQHEVISNINSEKNAVKELISAGYERLLDSISDLISRYKDALGAEKDLYDYERKIKELTDTRDAYVKQLSAYSGDTSEETRALIQEVTQKLKEANESLIDAEYDQYISDQEKMLDNLYSSLQEWVNARLDNIDGLIDEAVKATNENASTIAGTVQTEAGRIGSMLSIDEQSLLESMETEGSTDTTGGSAENNTSATIGSTIYRIQKYMSELPTKLDSLLGAGSPVSGLLKDIKDIIDQMRTAIVKTEPEISEGSYDFSDDDDNDDDDDDYEPAASPSPGGSPSASGSNPSKSNSSGNGKYSYDVTGGGSTQHVGITASSQAEADKKIADYVDELNDEDDDAGYGYRRHARGVYSLRRRELAWTQEEGREMILSPGRNAILTPLERGDSVLTKADTDNIYNWAKINPEDVLSRFTFTPDIPFSVPLPDIQVPDTNVSNDIDMTITLPNVSNYTEFVDQLQRDRRFEKIVQAMTIGNALGKNSYSKLKY